ncbi:MAG: nucleoside phosphorylase [Saprospiraceae bacterium]|nr:nucleoside phosphorylase [Saprospiraceae bacterium]MBP7699454.1 nucleoside phosphorylase [Saprospiraceae bacterium]
MTTYFPASELILNDDGSIYHLHLLPEQIATTVIVVGDPDRVGEVSKYFDTIEHKVQKREFVTHTGTLRNKRLTVISTGIGTDNIDIVFNELDALVNIDLTTRTLKAQHTTLDIIRIGTSGTIQPDIAPDSYVVSQAGIGMDGLMLYYTYPKNEFEQTLENKLQKAALLQLPMYVAEASLALLHKLGEGIEKGITITATGFYAPQGRAIRGKLQYPNLIAQLQHIEHESFRCTNLEMETAGIYGMAKLLGHNAVSFNAILANRATQQFSSQPHQTVDDLIQLVLHRLT